MENPETRSLNGIPADYRTFEIEELVENASSGLPEDRFGCRYAHAEYSTEVKAITHFDGAIRAYTLEGYAERTSKQIDRAGKQSDYTKLFRFDCRLTVSNWKSLLSNFYRGNTLIPEYFGAPEESKRPLLPSEPSEPSTENAPVTSLAAFISLCGGNMANENRLYSDTSMQFGSPVLPIVEVGTNAVAAYLKEMIEVGVTPISYQDKVLNLSRICVADSNKPAALFADLIVGLAEAIESDIDEDHIHRLSIPLSWAVDEFVATLTIHGHAPSVLEAITALPKILDLEVRPSNWIDTLAEFIVKIVPTKGAEVCWNGVEEGLLRFQRDDKALLIFPEDSAAGLACKAELQSPTRTDTLTHEG